MPTHAYDNPARRVLITGGAGFIGSHVGDRLVELGYQVVAFDNESTGCRGNVHPPIRFIHGDILDKAALEAVFREGIDIVIHLAPLLRRSPLEGDQLRSCADIRKARQLLDWQPGIDLQEGLHRAMAWAVEVQMP